MCIEADKDQVPPPLLSFASSSYGWPLDIRCVVHVEFHEGLGSRHSIGNLLKAFFVIASKARRSSTCTEISGCTRLLSLLTAVTLDHIHLQSQVLPSTDSPWARSRKAGFVCSANCLPRHNCRKCFRITAFRDLRSIILRFFTLGFSRSSVP